MIKKHLLTCTLVLVALVSSKFLVGGKKKDDQLEARANAHVVEVVERSKQQAEKAEADERKNTPLSFATEKIPTEEASVEKKLKRALKAHSYARIRTHKLHSKAAAWFPQIEPILEAYSIPEDFKYLPLVESGLVEGTSHRGASGHWQFMPATARAFGLKVNAQVDERQDVRKSTVAACKYLRALYREFGNWTLVAAAYNVGEGSLKRSMRNQNQGNYYRLKLNAETASYVYKLVSVKEIIENPLDYGFRSRQIPRTLLAAGDLEEESNRM